MNKILIVEDEKSIALLEMTALNKGGYDCVWVENGIEAANVLEKKSFDLIILDIMLPGCNGYELMEFIRPLETPVIFVSAKNDISDKIKGLSMGAEDYLSKPFSILELLARVEVVLRRYHKTDEILKYNDLVINTRAMSVMKEGTEISLTNKEYEIMLLFIRNVGIAIYRETIYERIWGEDFPYGSKAVDLHIQRLRKKLHWEEKLKAVSKVGYRLDKENTQ